MLYCISCCEIQRFSQNTERMVMRMDKNKSKPTLGYLLIFLAGAGWGTGGIWVTNMSQMGASSLMTGFTAHLFALPFLGLAILATKGLKGFKLTKRGLVFALIMGIVTKGFFKMAYDTTVASVGVSTGAVLLYTAPVFVAIMSMLVFKEKLYANNYLALAMNLVGVFLMVTLGDFANFNVAPLGILVGLLSAMLHASNTIMAKISGDSEDPLTMAFYMLVFSAIMQFFFAQPWTPANIELLTNTEFLFWAVINAFVTGAVGNLLYLKGMSTNIDASKAPVISSVEVIVATLMGMFIFNEQMNWIGVVGITLMLASIYLMNQEPKQLMRRELNEEVY